MITKNLRGYANLPSILNTLRHYHPSHNSNDVSILIMSMSRQRIVGVISTVICLHSIHLPTLVTASTNDNAPASGTLPTPALHIVFDEPSLNQLHATFHNKGNIVFISGHNGRPAAQFFGMDRPGGIFLPNKPEIQFADAATIDFWLRIDASEGMNGLTGKKSSAPWGMTSIAKSGDGVGFAILTGPFYTPDKSRLVNYLAIKDQTWQTLGCEVEETYYKPKVGEWFRFTITISNKSGIRLFMNGKNYATCLNSRPNFSAANTQDMTIGTYKNAWFPLHGAIQDMRIYAIALTDEQIGGLP